MCCLCLPLEKGNCFEKHHKAHLNGNNLPSGYCVPELASTSLEITNRRGDSDKL